MKRKLGISIYPEQSTFAKDKEYLDTAKDLGYEIMFTSALHFVHDQDFESKIKKVFATIKYAKQIGFYTILDVEDLSLKKMQIDPQLEKLRELGVDCIRLDTPLRASEIAWYTYNKAKIDIQLNMSNNDSLIDEIIDFKPIVSRINGCHNFYPLKYTALPFDFFVECNKKYLKHRLETSAFVGSHYGEMTTATGWKQLPTLEMQRELPIAAQAKILFYTNQIDNVLIGNAYAKKEELQALACVEREIITFDLKPEIDLTTGEQELLTSDWHYRRGDITEYFVRSTMTRVIFKDLTIKPRNHQKVMLMEMLLWLMTMMLNIRVKFISSWFQV
ncbi:hypothetical protein SCLARK_001107 [Spiroplasma clarkii]|nr:MupG family TIM beta-alpha barrel fold protein [Spiroplasma clarkii]ARU91676.1 hypothetical protein SCLARK_001107 [Spiroplasma clarkii]